MKSMLKKWGYLEVKFRAQEREDVRQRLKKVGPEPSMILIKRKTGMLWA